jgi:hypothetical protein
MTNEQQQLLDEAFLDLEDTNKEIEELLSDLYSYE